MRLLLPHVHRLLVLETALEEQNVNHTQVPDKAILFKLLADFRPDEGRGNVEEIVRHNARRLFAK